MSEAKEYEIKGNKLVCPICGQNRFWIRRTLLNTRGLTFFNLDWANQDAKNYVCDNCGFILWFMEE